MKKDNLSIQKIFTHSDITNIIQIIYFYQVNADLTIEDVRDQCKAACKTQNDLVANAGLFATCNKVCHLIISVLFNPPYRLPRLPLKTIFTGLWGRLQSRQRRSKRSNDGSNDGDPLKRSWGGRRHQLHSRHLSGRWSFDEVNVDAWAQKSTYLATKN